MNQKEKVSIGALIVVIIFAAIYFYERNANQPAQTVETALQVSTTTSNVVTEKEKINLLNALAAGSSGQPTLTRQQRIDQLKKLTASSQKSPPPKK